MSKFNESLEYKWLELPPAYHSVTIPKAHCHGAILSPSHKQVV